METIFGKFHLVFQVKVMNVQEKGGKSYFELLVNFKFEICKEIGFKCFLHVHKSIIQSPVSSNEFVTSLKHLVTLRQPQKCICFLILFQFAPYISFQ